MVSTSRWPPKKALMQLDLRKRVRDHLVVDNLQHAELRLRFEPLPGSLHLAANIAAQRPVGDVVARFP